MSTIVLKVHDKIPQELDLIQDQEGLGNRTSTIIFLIKYYLQNQKTSLVRSTQLMEKLLDRLDISSDTLSTRTT
jgi:metal-responsive CopG/Arc/MetJ family transcriptional regulator